MESNIVAFNCCFFFLLKRNNKCIMLTINWRGENNKPKNSSFTLSHVFFFLWLCLGSFRLLLQNTKNEWLLNSRNLLLTVLEAGTPRSGCQDGWMRALFLLQTSHCILIRWKGQGSSVGSCLLENLISCMSVLPLELEITLD